MTAFTDYADTMDLIHYDDANAQSKIEEAWRIYAAAKALETGGSDPPPDASINPHFIHDGVRMLAKVGAWLGEFYIRHKRTIDPFLDAALIAAFETIGSNASVLRALNNRGPT